MLMFPSILWVLAFCFHPFLILLGVPRVQHLGTFFVYRDSTIGLSRSLGFPGTIKGLDRTSATHECYLQELSGANPGYSASPQALVAQSSTFQSIPSQSMEIGQL